MDHSEQEGRRLLKFHPFLRRSMILGAFLALVPSYSWAKPRIVLDAAHGGSDRGVRAGKEVEKDWTQKIAASLQKALEGAGFEVVLARKGDSTLTGEQRSEAINTAQASLAIILHADRDWTGKQKGPYLVVEPPTRTEEAGESQRWGAIPPYQYRSSLKLARAIAQKLGLEQALSSLSDSRGSAGEAVSPEGRIYCLPHESLRYLTLPSVVLCPLFLTSSQDLKQFSKGDGLESFSAKVAAGVSSYLQVAQ